MLTSRWLGSLRHTYSLHTICSYYRLSGTRYILHNWHAAQCNGLGYQSGPRWWSELVFLMVWAGIPHGPSWYSSWSELVFLMIRAGIPHGPSWYSSWSELAFLMVRAGIPHGPSWYSSWSELVFLMVRAGIPHGPSWYSSFAHAPNSPLNALCMR